MLGQSLCFLHQKKSESRAFGASWCWHGRPRMKTVSEFPGRIESSVMASVQHLLFGADDLSSWYLLPKHCNSSPRCILSLIYSIIWSNPERIYVFSDITIGTIFRPWCLQLLLFSGVLSRLQCRHSNGKTNIWRSALVFSVPLSAQESPFLICWKRTLCLE